MNWNENQLKFLLADLQGFRVSQRSIGGGKKASYLESYDVRRHLIRLLGFGNFDAITVESECVVDQAVSKDADGNPNRWTVAYRALVQLTIRDEDGNEAIYSANAVGSSENQPNLAQAHDHALKTAESDALKRCAINLGTGFGLSLYQNGSLQDIVNLTLDYSEIPDEPTEEAPVVPEQPEPEQPEQKQPEPKADVPILGQDFDGNVDGVLEQIRAIYSLDTAAAKILRVGEMKSSLPPAALSTVIQDRQGNDMTIERALDLAASAAMKAPVSTDV